MRIQNNIPGMLSHRYGKELNSKTSKTLEKLSSGCRINRAGDDAAGLSMSEKIRVNLTGYERCIDNVREGVNLANTADAALQEVNDMLCRANELCVAAANGTYTGHEREQLLGELNALYDEMDRIFESSRFNSTQLFRHDDGDYSNGTFEYIEEVIMTDPDNLQQWGALGDIDRVFDLAEPARPATVTLTLDSDVRTAADLVGKSFVVKVGYSSYTVSFRSGTGYTSSVNPSIGVDDCAFVQDAFNKLCDISADSSSWKGSGITVEKAEVNGSQVVLTFDVATLKGADNQGYEIPGGDGTSANNADIISSELAEVGFGEDPIVCGNATLDLSLLAGMADDVPLANVDIQDLTQNTLRLYNSNGIIDITFANDGSGDVDLSSCNTVGDLRQAVADALISKGVTATYDGNGTIDLSGSNVSPSDHFYIREITSSGASVSVPTAALENITVTTEKLSAELPEITTVTLPGAESDYPGLFSVQINGRVYRFFDGSSPELAGKTVSENYRNINVKDMSQEQIFEAIRSCFEREYGSAAKVEVAGNQIVMTAYNVNTNLNVEALGVADSVTASSDASNYVLTDGNRQYGTQEYSVSLDLASAIGGGDAADLVGSGFQLNGVWYQFADDSSVPAIDGATLIRLDAQDSYDAIASKLQAAMPGAVVEVSGGILTISAERGTSNSDTLTFSDGYDGLFNEVAGTKSVQDVEAGTKISMPSAAVDFSGYTQENFRELYGKGFRVTCATCEGEYINVIFCYDKAQCSFPASFEKTDPVSGETRTIHNLAVELKGMSSGSDIVQSIVNQLSPELDHYTGVAVGNPSSVLEVYDKRRGDMVDPLAPSKELRAEVISGVLTNCVYTVKENFYAAPDDVLGDIEIDYRNVNIFANADDGEPYITIHLPYLTLKNLKLKPPEPDFSTPEKALQTMERVLQANNAIAYMRGRLGADSNRLEHAYQSLAQAQEQAADAYSRIRDADMADMMTEQTKLSILQQAQQAAQAHTLQMPQQILKLLQ